MVRKTIADLISIAGVALLIVGVRAIYEPLGWIVGGLAVIAIAKELNQPRKK